jgi:Tfp pilus assembly protein PilV
MNAKVPNHGGLNVQRGFSLVEALLSVVVGAVATLGLVGVDVTAIAGSSNSKAQGEALAMAAQKLEQLRSLDGLAGYQALASSTAPDSGSGTTGNFSRTWTVVKSASTGAPKHAQVAVTVSWQDSDGAAQLVTLDSYIAELQPAKTGQWYVGAGASPQPIGGGDGSGDQPNVDSDGEVDDETDVDPDGDSPSPGGDSDDADDDSDGQEDGEQGAPIACSRKQIRGVVTARGNVQAKHVEVSISDGSCTEVSGDKDEASFSCAVACNGTVTLRFSTSQGNASVSPASINVILENETPPITVAVSSDK